jgi:methylmalonyl-CoA mutase N-terminal domain/subunit
MSIKDEFSRWTKETLEPSLKKFSERTTRFGTSSGIELPRVALPLDEDPNYIERLGFPGEYP